MKLRKIRGDWGRAKGAVRPGLAVALLAFLIGSTAFQGALSAAPPQRESSAPAGEAGKSIRAKALKKFAKLPAAFEENRGQTDPEVDFLLKGAEYTLALSPTQAVFRFPGGAGTLKTAADGSPAGGEPLRMRLDKANPRAPAAGLQPVSGASNYLLGNDASKWITGVNRYAGVRYKEVYRGVDLVYHSRSGRLKYDFIVKPGADVGSIALAFDGVKSLRLNRNGDLILNSSNGPIRHGRPVVYQQGKGGRRFVEARYLIGQDRRVRFRLGRYDPDLPLVIDPTLGFSTFLGGTSDDFAAGIAVDDQGYIYVAGKTRSADFPTQGPVQKEYGGHASCRGGGTAAAVNTCGDAFVAKLDAQGSRLLYSTFLGGTDDEVAYGLDVDASGHAYLAGTTSSRNFPVKDGHQLGFADGSCRTEPQIATPPRSGGLGCATAFVAKLTPAGSGFIYSTYLGGTGGDAARGLEVDPEGGVHIVGDTTSLNFPAKNAFQSKLAANPNSPTSGDAFVAKFSSSGVLAYSTYLGGTGSDLGRAVAVAPDPDHAGNYLTYVTGSAGSPDFPARNKLQGLSGPSDAFVAKIDTGQSGDRSLLFSTYLGGSDSENQFIFNLGDFSHYFAPPGAIAAAPSGVVYVAGDTHSTDFPAPTAKPYQKERGGSPNEASRGDAFLVKLDTGSSTRDPALLYSTYLGGNEDDAAFGVTLDSAGRVFVAGYAESKDFPLKNSLQDNPGQACGACRGDAFVAEFDSSREGEDSLIYSTLLGGGGSDAAADVAPDSSGGAYVAGYTVSSDFPAIGGMEQKKSGVFMEGFVARVLSDVPGAPKVTGVEPSSGPSAGQREIVIRGAGFQGATAVRFGGAQSPRFTVNPQGNEIKAVTPAHPEGVVVVTVAKAGGVSGIVPAARFSFGEGAWRTSGALHGPRHYAHTATHLADGKVLVAGGCSIVQPGGFCDKATDTSEVFDPLTESWTELADASTKMKKVRWGHSATLLPDGRVLVVGGSGTSRASTTAASTTAELFDPAANGGRGGWSLTGSPQSARIDGHTATPLPDGKVLVTGGGLEPRAELYDPATGLFSFTAPMADLRNAHTATRLTDGRVLVAGGVGAEAIADNRPLSSAEIYDPASGSWRPTGSLDTGRRNHSATHLAGGKVLVAGGVNLSPGSFLNQALETAELYDPGSGAWSPVSPPEEARFSHAAVALPNGTALVIGGFGSVGKHRSAERYASESSPWRSAGAMSGPRWAGEFCGWGSVCGSGDFRAVLLSSNPRTLKADSQVCGSNCGKVLVVGGSPDLRTDLYTPAPTVNKVSPPDGPSAGGTEVEITGTGFTHGVRAVSFGEAPAVSYRVDGYDRITAVAPRHQAGDVKVTVVGEGGESPDDQTANFSYLVSGVPGRVTDLAAAAVSETEIRLTFSAPPSDGELPPPARRFVVKQADSELTTLAAFDAAPSLCGGECAFSPGGVGDKITISVKDLSPGTTYYYALKAANGLGLGPLSNSARATTLGSLPEGSPATLAESRLIAPPSVPAPAQANKEAARVRVKPVEGPGGVTSQAPAELNLPAILLAPATPSDSPRAGPKGVDSISTQGANQAPGWRPPVWLTAMLSILAFVGLGLLGAFLNHRFRGRDPQPS